MILLDTQVLVWSSFGDERLSAVSRNRLADAMLEGELFMSPISAWEIAMLADKGRLRLEMPAQDWIAQAAQSHGVRWTGLLPRTAATAGSLPGRLHGDPADRIIIASAREAGCPVLTSDRKILDYAEAGHVRAIDARR